MTFLTSQYGVDNNKRPKLLHLKHSSLLLGVRIKRFQQSCQARILLEAFPELPFYYSIDNTIGRPHCRGRKLLLQPEGPEIIGEFIFSRHPLFELSRVDGPLFKFAPDLQVLLPTRLLHTLDSNSITINVTGRRHHPHLTVRLGMIQGFLKLNCEFFSMKIANS